MPLASPSSLTSNTLATFLDHVPISTNNAEKWKPKQMGSNSGGDYWALARALSAPLGTKRWILHYLFLSTGTEVGGQKTVAAFCLHATETSASRCRWSFLSLTWGMNVLDCTWTFISVVAFFYVFYSLHDFLCFYRCAVVQMSVLHHLWDFSKIVSYCYRSCRACSMQTIPHTVAAVFCVADWHNKVTHCCVDMLGNLAVAPLLGQNRSM